MPTNKAEATPSPTNHQPKTKPASEPSGTRYLPQEARRASAAADGQLRYNGEIAARVCERIATTPQSLVEICEYPDMPGIATLFRWLHKYPEFRDMYVIAKQEQVEILMDHCFQLVNDTSRDVIVTDDGRTILNPVAVQRARLQVNYYKWIASKLLPRKYGNNAQLDTAAPPPPPPAEEDSGGGYVLTVERMLEMQALHQMNLRNFSREKEANTNANPPSAKEQEEDRYYPRPSAPPRG